jgi:hypothetical protein
MEDMKMTKTKNFEIYMNKLENVAGGSLVSKEPLMQLPVELVRPSLAKSRRPQLGIELEFGRPVKPPVVALK